MSLLSPLIAMLVALGAPESAATGVDIEQAGATGNVSAASQALAEEDPFWSGVLDDGGDPVANQVRIEQRVILRISPQPGRLRRDFLADLPRQPMPTRLVERPFGKCLSVGDIVGVADRGTRLLMYMRNRQIISAELEDACSPRDFYLGFYVEKNSDGKLCVGRDRLLSRAGAKCRISNLNRLVAVTEND
ncbi:hypothetical protein K3181_00980 [Qipengyuania sp. YG27]|uniref:DUF4893 domain-containing protein n=1 Tax=Qipengyuania mesophila TaxID=2867246 RepID=A0ABS7JQX7_9SPHN|nr:hypothetical protein [Qipengyuania mesophila]MBX7500013.1 hypothetical protein [Qipengyuania mesophila]